MSTPSYDKVTLCSGPLAGTTLQAPSSTTCRLELHDEHGRRVVYYGDTSSGTLHHDMLADALAGRIDDTAARIRARHQQHQRPRRRRPRHGKATT